MSNFVAIVATKFTNLDEEGNSDSESYGYRIFDDYANEYGNIFEEEDVRATLTDPAALLRMVQENGNDVAQAIIDHAMEFNMAIEINGEEYDNDTWVAWLTPED